MQKMLKRDMNIFRKTLFRLTLDPSSHDLFINKNKLNLPHKPQLVLKLIAEAAPKCASREMLIQSIWQGNHLVGEKALTQALWQIRSYLDSEYQCGHFIKTLPREGYLWTGPAMKLAKGNNSARSFKVSKPKITAGVAILAMAVVWARYSPNKSPELNSKYKNPILATTGTSAKVSSSEVSVHHIDGCIFNILAGPETTFRDVSFSKDGEKIAVSVDKEGICSMSVFEFKTRKREVFEGCTRA